MDVVEFIDGVKSLSAQYIDNNIDINVNNISIEQGLNIFKSPAFDSIKDIKIGNYSALYLTSKKYASDIITFKTVNESPVSKIITYLGALNPIKYLHIEPGSNDVNSVAAYTFKSVNEIKDPNRIYFEIDLLSDKYCRILHRNKNNFYYLTVNQDLNFYFTDRDYQNSSFNYIDDTVFEYIVDKDSDNICFYKAVSSLSASYNDIQILSVINNRLTLSRPNSAGIVPFNATNRFVIDYNNRQNTIEPKVDASWVSYDTINNININPLKSSFKEKNSYLLSTQYSKLTGNELSFNILPLKDKLSERENQNRGDYITQYTNKNTPNVDLREYEKIHIGSKQEESNNDIVLSYRFYNADYVFPPDQYTVFTTPKSLYPYSKINVNDTLIAKNGAFGGDSPHTADKIYCKLDQNNSNPNDGTYLCTWLSGGSNTSIGTWVDRFYNPIKTTRKEALSSSSVGLFDFTDPSECAIESGNVRDRNYYDRKSNLVFEKDKNYVYERIGNKYVKEFLGHLDNNSLIDNFVLRGSNGSILDISVRDRDNQTYDLTNSYYTLTSYDSIDKQVTLSFWIDADDWTKPFGHSIAGNVTNRGIGILNDIAITPFVTIHFGNILNIYNTSFHLIDSIDFKEPVRDVIREDALDNIYVVTDFQNIFKIQANGAIFDKKSIGIVDEYINYTIHDDIIYFIHSDRSVTPFNLVTEEFESTIILDIPNEDGISYPINSIVFDDTLQSLVGFRGDKVIKQNKNNYVFVIDNRLLVREDNEHTTRTVLMSSSTSIKDFAVDNDSFVYVLHDKNKLSKFTKDRLRIYQTEIIDSTPNNDELEVIAIDLVREYTENGLEQYPIVICNNKNNKLYCAKVDESTGQSTTTQLNDIYGKFYEKCNRYYLDNLRYNLTNYSYLNRNSNNRNTFSFVTKLDNIYNNQTSLNSRIDFDVSRLIPGSHHFVYRIDTISGNITVFVDGQRIDNVTFEPGKFALQSIFDEGLFIGATGFNNNILLRDYLNQPDRYFCKEISITQPYIYNTAISDIDVKFLNLNNLNISEVVASFPCGERNQMEQIERFFKWQLPGNKSNSINIRVKNNILTNDSLNTILKGEIMREISNALPASVTVKNITFENY